MPTDAEVDEWIAENPDGNICLRLGEVDEVDLGGRRLPVVYAGNTVDGWALFGIDVDEYDDKHGAQQLSELEAELGPLPATVMSSARWASRPQSGIRVFLVPRGFRYKSKVAKHIDTVHAGHRYMVACPSQHPSGSIYEWRGIAGDVPTLAEVAVLPETWFERLVVCAGSGADARAGLSMDELDSWAQETFRDCTGEPCGQMARELERYMEALDESDQHTPLNTVIWRFTMNAIEGHAGWFTAMNAYLAHWFGVSNGKRDVDTMNGEIWRSLTGALDKANALSAGRGSYLPEDTCGVDTSKYDCEAWGPKDEHQEDGPPSWAPVDIGEARRGVGAAPPTILRRTDGACLFYRGKTHSVHGESESGKSWLVQCATAEALLAGEAVLYIDFEDEGGPVAERLILLGVSAETVDDPTRFVYVHPDTPPTTDTERSAFDGLLSRRYPLAVVDGVTDSMGVFGLSTKDNDDIAKWQRALPKAIARLTGAAVVCVDHVTKDADARGRFALGGQHKMAGLSGAAYTIEMEQPFAAGQAGRASVRVGKDRPGLIRGLGGRWRKSDRTQLIAQFHLDSTDPTLTAWELAVPEDAGKSTETDGTKPTTGKSAFRPTWFMERVSRYWEETDDLRSRGFNKTVAAMCLERREKGRQQHRDKWREAIGLLEAEEYARSEPGPRDGKLYSVVKPYREVADPLSDKYSETAAKGVDGWKVWINETTESEAKS